MFGYVFNGVTVVNVFLLYDEIAFDKVSYLISRSPLWIVPITCSSRRDILLSGNSPSNVRLKTFFSTFFTSYLQINLTLNAKKINLHTFGAAKRSLDPYYEFIKIMCFTIRGSKNTIEN